jgi:hypothetical protein
MLAGFPPLLNAATTAATTPNATSETMVAAKPKTVSLSFGLDEIAKLAQSGTEESVMLSYIQTSPIAYRATADDIIQLREAGVSSTVLTAMMHRGGELRERAAQTQTPASAPVPQTVVAAAPAPATTYVAPVAYEPPTVSVVYVGGYPSYGYSYGYYGYGGCYSYPRYSSCYYPRFNTCSYPARTFCSAAFTPRFSVGASFGGGHRGGFAGGFHHRR